MKKILAAVLFLLPAAAQAQQTKAALTTEINTNLATGQPGGITALQLRTTVLDILNSIMPTAPVGAGNLACFSGTTGLLQDCGATQPTASIPAFAGGDVTSPGASLVLTIGANRVTLGMLATLAADKLIGSGAAGTPSAVSLVNCTTALTYNTTTHVFGCATPVTSVGITPSTSLSVSGSPVTSSGNITVTYRAPTMQAFPGSASGTYTTPANVSAIKVTLCGATGGGAGSGQGTTGGSGGTPAASTFSGGTLSCAGGGGGTASLAGTGSTCTGAGAYILPGKDGQAVSTGIAGNFMAGALGGTTPFVGTTGGRGGSFNGAGNTGGGGGGAGCAVQYIPSPAASYSYVLQSGGTAGTAGTSGVAGVAGDPAKLIVEEF